MPKNEDWGYYISLLQKDEELDETQKKIILNGWVELKQIFTDNWIKTANKQHPLLDYLKNQTLWSHLWIAYFGKRLSQLKGEIHDELKKRLLREGEFYPAYAEIEVASKLKENGYNVTFIKRTKEQTPDLTAEHEGRKLCVEITTMRTSSDWIKKRMIFLNLTEFSHQYPEINYFCTIHEYPPTTKEIKEKIMEKFEKVKESGYEELIKPSVFECYICTDENISQVSPEKRIKQGPMEFADVPKQVGRIKRRINNKVNQSRPLCKNKPNIVVIYDHSGFDLVIPILLENRINDLVNYLYRRVNKSSELSALVVIWTLINTVEESIEEKDNYIFSKKMEENGGIARYMLIIKNRCPGDANRLTSEEIELIKKL